LAEGKANKNVKTEATHTPTLACSEQEKTLGDYVFGSNIFLKQEKHILMFCLKKHIS
jgi:hypothetical protein